MRIGIALGAFALVVLALAAPASAQDPDRVRLAEIVPALAGSTLGALDLGPAPAPGTARTIRRAEILQAIADAHGSAAGLAIPARTRIERRAVVLDASDIRERARDAIASAVAPCDVERVVVTTTATVGEGELHVSASGPARPDDGAAVVMLELGAGALTTHVSARVDLECPDPVVHSGSHVTVVVRAGAVRASAPGVVRGEGRVGDVVHVRVESTGALVDGRVVDASTVEVTP